MTSMAEALGYGDVIDLAPASEMAWLHERRNPLNGEWIKSPGDEVFAPPKAGPPGSLTRYKVPDPQRLAQVKSGYRNPADHPWFQAHPVSVANLKQSYYHDTDEGMRAQGARWYPDVGDLAGKMTGGDREKGAILLSGYSPRSNWPVNMFNANRALELGRPLRIGEGQVMPSTHDRFIQSALDGKSIDETFQSPKARSFAYLIAHGDDDPSDPYGHVVVDVHALNAATGGNTDSEDLQKAPIGKPRFHEYVGDQYRQAAHELSLETGHLIKPFELQAILWLAQLRKNDAEAALAIAEKRKGYGIIKGKQTIVANAWTRWLAYAKEHDLPLEPGVTALAWQALLAQVIELTGGEDSMFAQVIDLFNVHELRDPGGRWTRGEGSVVHYAGSLGTDRADMPQLSGTVRGEYQGSAVMQPKFIDRLRSRGIPVSLETADPATLKPTQATGDIRVIDGIADKITAGGETKPIFVSADDRVADGHHTWAAHLKAGSSGMPVYRVGLPIRGLLGEMHAFGQEHGIARRATGVVANPEHSLAAQALGIDLASVNGHHVPGTPYTYRHGWIKIAPGAEVVPFVNDSLAHHTVEGGGLTPERQALHDDIVARMLGGHQREANPVATFLGGGTASGKTTAFGQPKPGEALIDPDHIKAQLPEFQRMTDQGDPRAAAYAHEESSALAKRIQAEAASRGVSFTLDGTGDGNYDKMRAKIEKARAGGHTVLGKYVTVDTEEAIRRADARGDKTGRYVPHSVIRELHAGVSDVFAQLIAHDDLDAAELWDNNGPSPVLVGEKKLGGTWTVHDQAAWERFLAKRTE